MVKPSQQIHVGRYTNIGRAPRRWPSDAIEWFADSVIEREAGRSPERALVVTGPIPKTARADVVRKVSGTEMLRPVTRVVGPRGS
jgi:hypothetical protein